MKFFKSVAVLGVLALMFGCSKNDPAPDNTMPPPEEPPIETIDLKSELVGRWTLDDDFSIQLAMAQGRSRIGATRGLGRTLTKQMDVSGSMNSAYRAFIEFLDNDTYLIGDVDGNAYIGSFEVGEDHVVLSELGILTGVAVEDGKISFDFTRVGSDQTVSVTGSKAETVELDDRTTKLVGTWELLPEEDGEAFYNEPFEIWGENDTVAGNTVALERLTLTFTKSGTYFMSAYAEGGTVVDTYAQYWQWHSSDPEKFVYWEDGWELDEEEDYVEVVRLDENLLYTNEYWEEENGEIEVTSFHFKRVEN